MKHVKSDMVVSFRYLMSDGKGEVLENRMDTPTSYLHGSAAILPSLQQQMEGLQAGDKRSVYLSNDIGDFRFDIVIASVRPALPEEVLLGYPIEVCDEDCICYIGQPETTTTHPIAAPENSTSPNKIQPA